MGEKVTLPHCQWLGLLLREGKMLLRFLEQWKVVADLAGEVGDWRAADRLERSAVQAESLGGRENEVGQPQGLISSLYRNHRATSGWEDQESLS